MTTLDSYFLSRARRPDFIKIDIEGGEWHALAGARGLVEAQPDLRLLVEWSPEQLRACGTEPRALAELIPALGLRCFHAEADMAPLGVEDCLAIPHTTMLLLSRGEPEAGSGSAMSARQPEAGSAIPAKQPEAAKPRPSGMHAIQPLIQVLPDSEMRELGRASLNRMPDLADWEPGGELSEIMGRMRQPVTIHRKSWEYALAIKGLTDLGAVRPEARALAVGAGSESPLYYFANAVAEMVATDLYDNPQHEGTPAMLADPRAFAPFPYREDHLKVLRMPGDRLDFPDASFDLAFCLSSIEHFGSRETQRRAFDEMARVVKPGAAVCVITELILTGHSHTEYFRWDEIESLFLRHPTLQLAGGEPDFRISESLVAFPVDVAQSRHVSRSPHIVLRHGDMLWTSFSLFFTRR